MVRVVSAAVAAASLLSLLSGPAAAAITGTSVPVDGSLGEACSRAALGGSDSAQALETCDRALELGVLRGRNLAGTHVNRGVLLMRRGATQAALEAFEQGVAIDPTLGEAFVDRGIARVALGQVAEGVADIDRGLELGLATPEQAYYHRAIAREQLNDVKGAYLDYRKAAELKPDWTSPRRELARFRLTGAR
jgi:tetratricopeptide (TPR) repeat protein